MSKKKIVNIISAGHSGSTILTKLLGQQEKIFGGGELTFYKNSMVNSDALCSCGESYKKCPFWSRVSEQVSTENLHLSRLLKKNNNTINYLKFFISLLKEGKFYYNCRSNIKAYLKLYKVIFEISESDVIIDSSKNFATSIILSNLDKYDTYFIFLHRDGRAVLNSYQKDSYKIRLGDKHLKKERDKPDENKTIKEWLFNNVYGLILMIFRSKKTFKISHEKIINNPLDSLNKMIDFIGLDIEKNELRVRFDKVDHIFGGNVAKINATKIEKRDMYRWKKNLDNKTLNKFSLWAGWMNRILGYK